MLLLVLLWRICVCWGCICVNTLVHLCECGGQRSSSVVISQGYCLPCVLKRGLSPTWSSPRLDLLASTPETSSCLYCPSAGFTSVHLTPDFVCGFWCFCQGSCAFTACSSTNGVISQVCLHIYRKMWEEIIVSLKLMDQWTHARF